MSYCYAESLSNASKVSTRWYQLISEPFLWKRLCLQPQWRLSRVGERKQLKQMLQSCGLIDVTNYPMYCLSCILFCEFSGDEF